MAGPIRIVSRGRRRAAALVAASAVLAPAGPARAACTWVQSVEGWNASVAWSYSHQAQWSDATHGFQATTQEQVSLSAMLESQFGVQASGPMDGTMSVYHRLVSIPPEGASGYVQDQGTGPPDAYAPPPPQLYLFVDGFSCTYQFTYDTTPATDGTSTVKSGCCTNTTDAIVESGDLVSGMNPIPETRQPLSFSGTVPATTETPTPPFDTAFYDPISPAALSAEYLGEAQLGRASVQWSFQPEGSLEPPNDECPGATAIGGFGGGAAPDVSAATAAGSDPTPTCGAGDRSVWFLVQVLAAASVTVDTTGSDYGTVVSVWPMGEPCNALATQVACGGGDASWNAEPGMYRVQVTRGSGAASGLVVNAFVPEPAGAAPGLVAALALAWRRRCSGRCPPRRLPIASGWTRVARRGTGV